MLVTLPKIVKIGRLSADILTNFDCIFGWMTTFFVEAPKLADFFIKFTSEYRLNLAGSLASIGRGSLDGRSMPFYQRIVSRRLPDID